jgi:integrative and conjugative element protein (TIGR02256 family)
VRTFSRPDGGVLVVGEAALAVMQRHRQMHWRATEAGGVLLGRVIVERPDILIDVATEPAPEDKRSRFRFTRARVPTQRAINAAHAMSSGECIYLGEWHTHPEDYPRPSGVDLTNWNRLVRDAQFEQESLFFLIMGRAAVHAWEVPKAGGAARSLAVVVEPSAPPLEKA